MIDPSDRRMHVAVHEAGHAAIWVNFGIPLEEVSIKPSGNFLGHTTPELGISIDRETDCLTKYAGSSAEQVLLGIVQMGATQELLCLYTRYDYEPGDSTEKQYMAQANNLVARYEPAIRKLAEVLLERETITGACAMAILRDT